jgi:hypothetical protein
VLRVEVERLAGDSRQILYRFVVGDGTTAFAEGRATVVLNTPLDLAAFGAPAASGADRDPPP